MLVPLPDTIVEAFRTAGLDDLLYGSEFGVVSSGALVKYAVGLIAFNVSWERTTGEPEYSMNYSGFTIRILAVCIKSRNKSILLLCVVAARTEHTTFICGRVL